MEQVAHYLRGTGIKRIRQALVRMWVLARPPGQLRQWEIDSGSAQVQKRQREDFADKLRSGADIDAESIAAAPLAFIEALDAHIQEQENGGSITDHRIDGADASSMLFGEDGASYWLLPVVLTARAKAAAASQVGTLSAWFRHNAVVPAKTAHGLTVQVQMSQSRVQQILEQLLLEESGHLRAWIGHFNDGADVHRETPAPEANRWRASSVQPHERRVDSIRETIERAGQAGAQVVVLPEFTVDCKQRESLAKTLREGGSPHLALVLAGSFHETLGKRAFNTAPLLGSNGQELLKHHKLRLYGNRNGVAEDVSAGDIVQVLATPIGCFAVLICKDFMDADMSVASLFQEVPVDWILVPSFGDEKTVKKHRAKADELARVAPGASSVVANTRNTARNPDDAPLWGFAHAAGEKDAREVGIDGGLVELPFSVQPGRRPGKPTLKRVK